MIKNKKATFEYFLFDKYTSGIVLVGTEIKSIKKGKASLVNSYCTFIEDELYLMNSHIEEYTFGNINNHDPKRNRKLLLNKKELKKIKNKITEKGLTIVPTKMFINENGYCKVEIAIAKGKKLYDKRQTKKEKDIKKQLRNF